MPDRGGTWFNIGGKDIWWKRCEVAGCRYMVCHRLSKRYCYPHSQVGSMLIRILEQVERDAAEQRRVAAGQRHGMSGKDPPQ